MPMHANLRRAALLTLAGWVMLTLSACGVTGGHSAAPSVRSLPAAAAIIPDAAPRPEIRKGDDARLIARRALDYGDQNALRLGQARDAYERVIEAYGRPAEAE